MLIQITKNKATLVFIILFLFLSMTFAGCGVFSRSETGVSEPAIAVEEAPAAPEEGATQELTLEEEKAMAESDVGYEDTSLVIEQKVIKTAYMELEVEKKGFEKALFDITKLSENSGGFVSSTQSYSDEDGNLTSGSISIRIPQDKYNSVIDKIKTMGNVKSISISGQDVTQEYIDLESRLRNYQAQEEILLDLMAQSKKVADSVEVQRELSKVQEQIEIIKGRMNYLDNMVSFSTIDVYLFEPEPITTTTGWGLLDALKRGLRGAVTVFNWLVTIIIAASPVLAVLAIIGVIIWLIIRARLRRRVRKSN